MLPVLRDAPAARLGVAVSPAAAASAAAPAQPLSPSGVPRPDRDAKNLHHFRIPHDVVAARRGSSPPRDAKAPVNAASWAATIMASANAAAASEAAAAKKAHRQAE